jgi:peptide/nickel transport system permease protein
MGNSAVAANVEPRLDTAEPLVVARGVRVVYGSRRETTVGVVGADLDIPRGKVVGLVGESGSGKSSLGNAIMGLVPLAGGTVSFDGHIVSALSRRARRGVAGRMQMVFQDPFGSMNPLRTVGDTVGESLRYALRWPVERVGNRVAEVLAEVGLDPSAADRYPTHFSGGQRQRIAIARAIATDPELLVCDEPLSALDLSVQAQVLNLLTDLVTERNLAMLFISHDLAVVNHVCDVVAVMRRGEIVELGTAEQINNHPQHEYTRTLIAAVPSFNGSSRRVGESSNAGAD